MLLSAKKPDRSHPFGYGRVEYLASLAIGVLILYAGLDAFRKSLERILHPQSNDYSLVTLILVTAGIAVKLLLGLYTKKKGAELDSGALRASGRDALVDSVVSTATLVAAIVQMLSSCSIEAWIGVGISLFIVKMGIDTLRESTGIILGQSTDLKLAAAVRKSIRSFPEVEHVYDIVIHSYGKEKLFGSAHVEVDDRYTVAWIDNLQRAIERRVWDETGVEMLGVSIYAINTKSPDVVAAREAVREAVSATEGTRHMHGFYIDLVDKTMNFVVEVGFGVREPEAISDEVLRRIKEKYPDYEFKIAVTYDFTD